MGKAWTLMKETVRQWSDDKVSRLAASIAFFTIFSLAPLFIVVIAIAGAVFGREAATGEILEQMRGLVGAKGAEAIEQVIQNASQSEGRGMAAVVSVIMLLVGVSGVFIALQDALNTVWGVRPKPGMTLKAFLHKRVMSFALVVVVAFLLLVSLAVSAALSGLDNWLNAAFPGGGALLQVVNVLISFVVIMFLFAIMFKYLPDAQIAWKHVWIGALVTTVLFTIGKYLIGLYLGNSSTASVYGAAGSLAVLLIWFFYSAQILLFGAEFTQVYASSTGDPIEPDDQAEWITEAQRAKEGIPRRAVTS